MTNKSIQLYILHKSHGGNCNLYFFQWAHFQVEVYYSKEEDADPSLPHHWTQMGLKTDYNRTLFAKKIAIANQYKDELFRHKLATIEFLPQF